MLEVAAPLSVPYLELLHPRRFRVNSDDGRHQSAELRVPCPRCTPATFAPVEVAGSPARSSPGNLDAAIADAFGPGGLGLILVSGVPGLTQWRGKLLSQCREFAGLAPAERATLLKSQKLGTDVPQRGGVAPKVCSAACQLTWAADDANTLSNLNCRCSGLTHGGPPSTYTATGGGCTRARRGLHVGDRSGQAGMSPAAPVDLTTINQGMHALGLLMVDVCAAVAGACDRYLQRCADVPGAAPALVSRGARDNMYSGAGHLGHGADVVLSGAVHDADSAAACRHRKSADEEASAARRPHDEHLQRAQEAVNELSSGAAHCIAEPTMTHTRSLVPEPDGPLQSALLAACTAKARLIHYYHDIASVAASGSLSKPSSASAAARGIHVGGPAAVPSADTRPCLRSASDPAAPPTSLTPDANRDDSDDLPELASWQGWHFDYGLFTALTGPSYSLERPRNGGDDGDQVDAVGCAGSDDVTAAIGAGSDCGLVVLRRRPQRLAPALPVDTTNAGFEPPISPPSPATTGPTSAHAAAPSSPLDAAYEPVVVHIPDDCIAVQIGEAAQILSGGRLAATPHCVRKPTAPILRPPQPNDEEGEVDSGAARLLDPALISRQTFVVFCQPAWDAIMTPSGSESADGASMVPAPACTSPQTRSHVRVLSASEGSTSMLSTLLPPLASRWAPGISYSDFSKRTTKAYFGASGVQAPATSNGKPGGNASASRTKAIAQDRG